MSQYFKEPIWAIGLNILWTLTKFEEEIAWEPTFILPLATNQVYFTQLRQIIFGNSIDWFIHRSCIIYKTHGHAVSRLSFFTYICTIFLSRMFLNHCTLVLLKTVIEANDKHQKYVHNILWFMVV